MSNISVREANVDDAASVYEILRRGAGVDFGSGSNVQPLVETPASVAAAIATHGGLICDVGGSVVAAVLFEAVADCLELRCVGVAFASDPAGIASTMVGVAEQAAAARDYGDVRAVVGVEQTAEKAQWRQRGYAEVGRTEVGRTEVGRTESSVILGKPLPVRRESQTSADTFALGERLAGLVHAGDLLILSGPLGAGKTTLTQGIGAGLRVRGPITSPTFVVFRVHPSSIGGPSLVHADAYRLSGSAELDDLDIDSYAEGSVTVVEWGEGIAEGLSADRLHVHLAGRGDRRLITVTPVGARWFGAGLRPALSVS